MIPIIDSNKVERIYEGLGGLCNCLGRFGGRKIMNICTCLRFLGISESRFSRIL
jgi:hypothetical protein